MSSILDKNIDEIAELNCEYYIRDQICEFMHKYMGPIDGHSDFFSSDYNGTLPGDQFPYIFSFTPFRIVNCSVPRVIDIFDQLRIIQQDPDIPLIIHDFDGETLPDYIKFICNQQNIYDVDYGGYVIERKSSVNIYIHKCPNLRGQYDINFINLD